MRESMLSRLNFMRTDYLWQAEEIAHFAQSTEIELRGKHFGRDLVNNVELRDAPKCYKCVKPGHLEAACPERSREGGTSSEVYFVLTVDGSSEDDENWFLNNSSSRHLVNDDKLLEDTEEYVSDCVAADGGSLRITKRGSVTITTTVMGKTSKVRLLDGQYAENLERNIISYGLLESKGFGLSYRGKYHVVAGMNDGPAVVDVEISNNVLIVLAQVLH
uniref:Uncharacterized protein AlNc14C142G7280 n=1 Tax=Albugo laibachii Nc14 TaxID=890382 RepID=F0WL91_9STRA|nr:conserved hypothetical protein [Albugo laibachii Nc14]|eukprot:CCA22053.1 conserved hypothetical protein [Albugo laibachii Nc14]